MMIDCYLACPAHDIQYRVERVPTGLSEGVYENRIVAVGSGDVVDQAKGCPECGQSLVRQEESDGRHP